MGFFRPLQETAPGYDPRLPWPLDGLAYVIMFTGPPSGGGTCGLLISGVFGLALGLAVGSLISAANALVFDRLVERQLARLQHSRRMFRTRFVTNLVGFTWAIAVCALAILLTVLLADRLGIIDPAAWERRTGLTPCVPGR